MRVAINAWFWNSHTTGRGQYTRCLVEHLIAIASELDIRLIRPRAGGRARNLYKVWFEQVIFPRACLAHRVDVAHVPYWAPPMTPQVPTLITIHDLIPLLLRPYRGGPAVRLYTALVSTTAQSAVQVLTDSRASQRDIVTHLGLPAERVRVIPLAVDARYTAAPAPGDAEVHARYGLPDQYTLYLGGFDVRKNVTAALAAYRWVGPALDGDCPLVIAGRLPDRDTRFTPDPRRLAREWGVEPFVHYTGYVAEEDKPALYRGAAAFIFPSRYEGFGLPILEAMACGTPVVGSDVASVPEVVADAGVLLPPDDAEGMAGALIQLVTDKGFHADMRRRAIAQAGRFSWERTARETLAAYRSSLSS